MNHRKKPEVIVQDTSQSAKFIMGADLSYVNQVEDLGGAFKENNVIKDPFAIFSDHGTNMVRLG